VSTNSARSLTCTSLPRSVPRPVSAGGAQLDDAARGQPLTGKECGYRPNVNARISRT
jgi:hypothetical protein